MKTKKRTIKDALAEAAAAKVPDEEGRFLVPFACGHLDLFELGHNAKKCMDCRLFGDADFREKSRALEQLRIEKEAKGKQAPAEQLEPATPGGLTNGSLPDGALFVLLYSAVTKTWVGSLKIGDVVFSEKNCGRFKLMRVLDAEYRKTLAPVAEEVT